MTQCVCDLKLQDILVALRDPLTFERARQLLQEFEDMFPDYVVVKNHLNDGAYVSRATLKRALHWSSFWINSAESYECYEEDDCAIDEIEVALEKDKE